MFGKIQNYSKYLISDGGDVLNVETRRFLKGSTNPAGYVNFRLTDDSGHTHTWGRHRLLAYVFKDPAVDISDLVVNHKNGIKGDDHLDNLEWVTRQENTHHAGLNGLSSKCIPILVRDVCTGIVDSYPSVISASIALNLSKDAVLWRLKSGSGKIFPELKQYKATLDKTDWLIPEISELDYIRVGPKKTLLLMNIETNEVTEFERSYDLANTLGVLPSTVTSWLHKKDQPLILWKYLLKEKGDITPWRKVGDKYLEMEKSLGLKAVVVYNDKETRIFRSCPECARAMSLGKTTLFQRLKARRDIIYKDGFKYRYYSEFTNSPFNE